MQYLEIPVAVAIGWVIWRDLPNGLALVGIAVTIAAGLYIILRERDVARHAARSATQAAVSPASPAASAPASPPHGPATVAVK